jgi:hypothetical protein
VIARFASVTTALAIGVALCACFYWMFLNTPESNTLTLTTSALLIIAFVIAAAVAVNAAVLLARGASSRTALGGAARGVFWFVLALAPLAAGWWAVGQMDAWVDRHSGEINAWFIARLGWADVSGLLEAQVWVSRWLRWAVFPVLSLSLLATLLSNQGSAPGASFVRRAWHWRTLAVATLVYILLFALPWQLTDWRPELPPTWIEPTTAALRLGLALLLALAGAGILIIVSAQDRVAND